MRIRLVIGMASAVYFGANAFIPDYLDQTGRRKAHHPDPGESSNASQLLTALAGPLWERLLTGRVSFIGSAVLMGLAQIDAVVTPGPWVVVCAFVLGFSTALAHHRHSHPASPRSSRQPRDVHP